MPPTSQDNPLVSVITPVYNGARHLARAIHNIRGSGYENLEIILVDDASTDDSANVARELADTADEIRLIALQENAGPAAARNRGLEESTGEIIAFLDVDDEWPEASFKARLDYLLANPDADIALGKVQCVRHSPGVEGAPDQREVSEVFVSFNLGAALYRRSVFEKVGAFNPEMRYAEDTDWFMRAREMGVRLQVLPEVGLIYHVHEGGMTHGKKATEMNMLLMLKMSLDRRRQAGTNAQNLPELQGMPQTTVNPGEPGLHLRFHKEGSEGTEVRE